MWFGRKAKRKHPRKTAPAQRSPGGRRALAMEFCEPRLLLTHDAPELNPALLASLPVIQQNQSVANNKGETIGAMLGSNPNGTVLTNPNQLPMTNGNFAFFDESDGGQEGIAVTGLTGTADGVWEWSADSKSWSPFPIGLSSDNALLLSGGETIRFLPDKDFAGQVTFQFRAWDASDGKSSGATVNLDNIGGDGAFSTATAAAKLGVAGGVAPFFNIVGKAPEVLENNNGGNAGLQTATNVVSGVLPGNGGNSTVTYSFTSSPGGYVLNPAIDANGTLTFNLAQGAYGTVTLNVWATNGALSFMKSTHIQIDQTTPPSFSASSEDAQENSGAASDSNWAQNFSYGMHGDGGSLTYSIISDSNPGLFAAGGAPAIDGSGTLTFTPAAGQIGQAALKAVVNNGRTGLTSAQEPFTIGVYALPSFSLGSAPVQTLNSSGQQTVNGEAYAISSGTGNSGDALSFVVSNNTNPELFSVQPAISSTGTLTYTPAANKIGTASVTVYLYDGADRFSSQTKTFSIGVYAAPSFSVIPAAQTVENAGAQSVSGEVSSINSGTPNTGDPLSFVISSDSDPGLFSVPPAISSTGTLTYTPASGRSGLAAISVYLRDGFDGYDSPTESVTIGVYGAPTATAKSYVIDYTSASSAGAATGMLAGDTDPNSGFDGGPVAQVKSWPSFGTSFDPQTDGSFAFTPGSSFEGFTRFTYQIASGPATSAIEPVTLYSHEGAMVMNVFNEVLIRGASDADIENWAPQLHSGLSMGTFAGYIITSDEHLNTVVTSIFEALLGHAPSADQESTWAAQWRADGGPKNVWANVAAYTECFNYAATRYTWGNTNEDWVALIYQAILGRAANSNEVSYYAAELGSQTPQQIVNTILGSVEYRDDVINYYYNQYLLRAPSSSDRTYWEGQLGGGVSQLTFQELLIGSAEYAANPPAAANGNADPWSP